MVAIVKNSRMSTRARSARRINARLAWLRKLYPELNARHWEGQLPEVYIRVEPETARYAGNASTSIFNMDIAFSGAYVLVATAQQLRQTLLHEMCHVAVRDQDHGPRWRAEMERVGCAMTRALRG